LKISSALLLLISDQIKRLIPIENIRRRIITVVMISIGIFIRSKYADRWCIARGKLLWGQKTVVLIENGQSPTICPLLSVTSIAKLKSVIVINTIRVNRKIVFKKNADMSIIKVLYLHTL